MGRIFDMFVQGKAPVKRIGGGLGIGLALARRIAEMHDGTLEAYSDGEDAGSEFVLQLPLAVERAASAADSQVQEERVAQATGPRRVLVVDDNVDAASTLELLLRSLGHETRVVHDGHHALRAAAEFRPDAVLLDIGLPGLDGYEVARRLGALKKERPFRIVAITGWGQEMDRIRSREAGFDVHLLKPVDMTELVKILNEKDGATVS